MILSLFIFPDRLLFIFLPSAAPALAHPKLGNMHLLIRVFP